MNEQYYNDQLNLYKKYRCDLQVKIDDLNNKIDSDYFKGKLPSEYQKALDTQKKYNSMIEDLNFNIEWFLKKVG